MDKSEKGPYEILEDEVEGTCKVHKVEMARGMHLGLYFALQESTNKCYWIVSPPHYFSTGYDPLDGSNFQASAFIATAVARNLSFSCYDKALKEMQALDPDVDYAMSTYLDNFGKAPNTGWLNPSTENKGGAS